MPAIHQIFFGGLMAVMFLAMTFWAVSFMVSQSIEHIKKIRDAFKN